MPTRVLIIENDLTFATELSNGLQSLGAEATVVEDPNQGLQIATTERPSLIVLAVELHKMNGFSVCSRIKKESSLSSIPVVLVTSNSTDVTIEQHRQRPNHADDYVRKPVAIQDLVERLRQFISLGQSMPPGASVEDDEILIDDEVLEVESNRPPSMRSRNSVIPVDSDVSTFTDNAFDGIMTERPASVIPRSSATLASIPPSRPSQTNYGEATSHSSPSAIPPSVGPNSESDRVHMRVLQDALDEATSRIRDLESRDLSAKEAELESLRRELDEARAKLMVAGRGGTPSGTTARDVLDLREQLHKKEKELLDLRDRLTQREKEVLNLKDTSLGVEREKADLSDRLDEIARQLAETQRHADAARSDKEAAAKRAEDAKRRIEKLTQQLEEKAQELDQRHAAVEAEREEYAREKLRWVEEREATERHAADELRSAMAQASAEINQQAEKARLQLEQSLVAAEDRAQQRIAQAIAETTSASQADLQRELDSLRHELSEDKAAALAAQEREISARVGREHDEAKAAALAAQERELTARLTREHDEAKAAALAAREHDVTVRLTREHGEELAQTEAARREELARAEAAHRDELTRVTAKQAEELAATSTAHADEIQRLRAEHGIALSQAKSEFEQAIEGARAELESAKRERDSRIDALLHELEESKHTATDLRDRCARLERQLELASSKWAEDRVNIERTKDALAVALVQLEAIEQRPLESP